MAQYDNKYLREKKEMKSLFEDKRFSRQAWQAVGQAMLRNPAHRPALIVDKDGQQTEKSYMEEYNYNKLCADIKQLLQEDREPTELEMILGCQIIKARTDTNAAIFVRDTLGAKPIDESKLDATVGYNPYEELTDEELDMLAKMREAKNGQKTEQ